MARNRAKEVKLKKMLIAIWAVFIIVLVFFGLMVYKKKDVVEQDLSFTTRFSYQTNANPDINALMITYLSAMAASDQDTLKSCVTDPSQFDNMATVQSQSKIITTYSNINCYTVEGMDEESTLCYVVANISIVSVESTPLDIMGPFYVVKKGNNYLIDNSMLGNEVNDYIEKVNRTADIQDLYKVVKENEEQCAAQDPAFKEFLDRLNN